MVKGVSNLFAAVLLLMIAVSLVTSIYLFLPDITVILYPEERFNASYLRSRACLGLEDIALNGTQCSYDLRNCGQVPLTDFSILMNGQEIDPGSLSRLQVLNPGGLAKISLINNITAGNYSFLVVSDLAESPEIEAETFGDGETLPDGSIRFCTQCISSAVTPKLDIVLVLDSSSSMEDTLPSGQRKIDVLVSAVRGFVDNVVEGGLWRIGVVEFESEVRIRVPLTLINNQANKDYVKSRITGITGTGTNTTGGIDTGTQMLNNTSDIRLLDAEYLVLISDGEATRGYGGCNSPGPCGPQQARESAAITKNQSVTVDENSNITLLTGCIDCSASAADFMKSLASDSSTFINAVTAEELTGFFDNLLTRICTA